MIKAYPLSDFAGKYTDLVNALRCTNGVPKDRDCKKCKYFRHESEEDIEKFCKENDVKREDFGEDFWGGCDYERIGLEAADAICELAEKHFAATHEARNTLPVLR